MTRTSAMALVLAFLVSSVDARAVMNGAEINESVHPATKKVTIGRSGVCTGTFIGPHTMITAAHCVKAAGASSAAGKKLRLTVDGVSPVGYRAVPKYFSKSPEKFPNDVAVVEFAATKTFPFAAVVAIDKCVKETERVEIVGYGMANLYDGSSSGVRRSGWNVIDTKMFGQLMVRWATNEGKKRGMTMPGDSGGPWYNGDGEIVGVTNEGSGQEMVKGPSPTYLGAAVDLCEPEIRAFLKKALAELRTGTAGH